MPTEAAPSEVVIAGDAGTTGVRAFAVDRSSTPQGWSYREFTQHFPQPGWVEHDANEIWTAVQTTIGDLCERLPPASQVVAVGITNQRETVVAWDRRTGEPLHRAIVWQDRRTAARCEELEPELGRIRAATGLVLDPYFSASKMEWLLRTTDVGAHPDLALGTIDDWILWKLTGEHATDPSNASRTMLYDITARRWDEGLCSLFGVPIAALGDVRASSGRFGTVREGPLAGVPVSGVLGDQQAALLGQAALRPGMAKNTYGTGSFVLMNVGSTCPAPSDGLLTTVAWDLGRHGFAYALEGAVFATGAAIQWLRDGLQIISEASEIGPLAESVAGTDGVYFVPAFTGLGSPWWDPYARGTIVGLTRGIGRAHLARAVVESIAFQVRDVVDRMIEVSGTALAELRVDGGASVMDLLLRLQADQLGVAVSRPSITETTALGAAYAAGLAEGAWESTDDVAAAWKEDTRIEPQLDRTAADAAYAGWRRAVERASRWATD